MISDDELFAPNGPIARHLPGYRYRPQQRAMLEAIREGFAGSKHSIIEAPTGSGKGLAALLAAVGAIEEGRVVIYSTHTKALQAQLLSKDIPALLKMFPRSGIMPAILKGKGNSACKADFDNVAGDIFINTDDRWSRVEQWMRETKTGDVADLGFSWHHWKEIAAKRETCRKQDCHYFNSCFYYETQRKAKSANLIVVNHALLLADLWARRSVGEGIIPEWDFIIIDEAHALAEAATEAFSIRLDEDRIFSITNRLRRHKLPIDYSHVDSLESLARQLFSCFTPQRDECFFHEALQANVYPVVDTILAQMGDAVASLSVPLTSAVEHGGLDEDTHSAALAGKNLLDALFDDVGVIFDKNWHNDNGSGEDIRWVQIVRRGGNEWLTLVHSPVQVGKHLNSMLWSKTASCALTSATLATHGGFTYLRKQLGLQDNCIERILPSPFDYKKQAMLYVPHGLPEPPTGGSVNAGYSQQLVDEIGRLLVLTGGRTFILLTSRRQLEAVRSGLEAGGHLGSFDFYVQGDSPSEQLLQRFRDSSNGVLLGLASFWEGVDVPGEALSAVIIDRIPFAVPDSPLTKARTEAIKKAGGNWFMELALPYAQIRLKQGFGRLIRTTEDTGLVCILDTRLLTKQYAPILLSSLPAASRSSRWAGVERWWNETRTESVLA